MQAGDAWAIARQWVIEHAGEMPGFAGAYLAGSINDLPDDALVDPSSDIDIMIVIADGSVPMKPGKLRFQGALLEVSIVPLDQIRTPEEVLAHYHLAGAFRRPAILADPTGHLTRVQHAVGNAFAERAWVERRCEMAADAVRSRVASIDPAAPFHNQAMSWLFAAGGLPHVLLVAALRNPTVRKRFVAAREVLEATGQAALYPELLRAMGCEGMTSRQVAWHLDVLAGAFDAATGVGATPVFFASDLSPEARPIAIDGSRRMIEQGDQREAMFWIVATFSRCMIVFANDDPDLLRSWEPAYRALLAGIGIRSTDDLVRGGGEILALLSRVEQVARVIVDATNAGG